MLSLKRKWNKRAAFTAILLSLSTFVLGQEMAFEAYISPGHSSTQGGAEQPGEMGRALKEGIRKTPSVKLFVKKIRHQVMRPLSQTTGLSTKTLFKLTAVGASLAQGKISTRHLKYAPEWNNLQIRPDFHYQMNGQFSATIRLNLPF